MDDEPSEPVTSLVTRTEYAKSLGLGMTAATACTHSRRTSERVPHRQHELADGGAPHLFCECAVPNHPPVNTHFADLVHTVRREVVVEVE